MSDRKYGQPGYQDSSDSSPRERKSGPRPERRPGPSGRGFGKPTATVFRCSVCGDKQGVEAVGVNSECGKCKAELHTCTHCMHFDSSLANECRRPGITYISSKAKANSCPEFTPKASKEIAQDRTKEPSGSDAKSAFDALFNF